MREIPDQKLPIPLAVRKQQRCGAPRLWLLTAVSAALALAVTACGSTGATPGPAKATSSGSAESSRTAEITPAGSDTDTGGGGGDVDGNIPDDRSITPFDTGYSAVKRLDSRLLKAVQKADEAARTNDISFVVTSGWRSKKHQQQLLDAGIQKYGSLEKARQFVNTPDKSTHVSGKAIDIGPTDADDWLIQHGSAYGLCQAYSNEMWHFELLTEPGGDCPVPLPDAAG